MLHLLCFPAMALPVRFFFNWELGRIIRKEENKNSNQNLNVAGKKNTY